METKFVGLTLLLSTFLISTSQSHASAISPGDFGSNAVIQTFDSNPAYSFGYAGSFISDGVTYSFNEPGYVFSQGTSCISGTCLGSYVTNAQLLITLNSPVNLVGGYLLGSVSPTTDLLYYDANGTLLNVGQNLFPVQGSPSSFFSDLSR